MPNSNLGGHYAPLTSVVVATDFSPGGTLALKRAASLPLAPGAHLSILHVQPEDVPTRMHTAATTYAAESLARAITLLADEAHAAGNSEVRVKGIVATGRTFKEIIRNATRREAELIVLGRHGRSSLGNFLIGTTAQRVVRLSKTPVLVVNLASITPYRRPLLATDLGPSSSRVAEFGTRLINRKSVKLMVLHAWDIPFRGWLTTSDLSPESMPSIRDCREEASRDITNFVASLEQLGVQAIPLIRRGNPRFVVLDEVTRRKPDLAVVGTHGRAGLPRTILGTVAETLVAGAMCDVLVVQ